MTTLETTIHPVPRWDFIPNADGYLLYSDQGQAMVPVDDAGRAAIEALQPGARLIDWVEAAAGGGDAHAALRQIHPLLDPLTRAGLIGLDAPPEPVDWASKVVHTESGGSRTCYLSLTDNCNLKCSYCYNEDERAEALACGKRMLRDDEIKGLLDRLAAAGFQYVIFTGGEPMLRKSIFSLAEHARGLGLGVNLLTNGTAFTKRNAGRVAELFETITVSLDSAVLEDHDITRGKGSWARIVKGLDLLVKAGARALSLRPVVTVHNMDRLHLLPDFANGRWGVTSFKPSLYLPNSAEELDELALLPEAEAYQASVARFNAVLERIPGALAEDPLRAVSYGGKCGMADSIFSVSASGDVYPCQSLHFDPLWMGNVRTHGVEELFANGKRLGIVGACGLDVPECQGCPYQMVCGGGCRASAYKMRGDMAAHNTVMCRHLRIGAQSQLRRYAEYKRKQHVAEPA
ncbi:MAG: radical SAM protein [Rhodobacter sp.]|nr:radical SAM protein [Rhodobacter sp.]